MKKKSNEFKFRYYYSREKEYFIYILFDQRERKRK